MLICLKVDKWKKCSEYVDAKKKLVKFRMFTHTYTLIDIAAISCSPNGYRLGGAGLVFWLTGKPRCAWHQCMASVHGWCMGSVMMWWLNFKELSRKTVKYIKIRNK